MVREEGAPSTTEGEGGDGMEGEESENDLDSDPDPEPEELPQPDQPAQPVQFSPPGPSQTGGTRSKRTETEPDAVVPLAQSKRGERDMFRLLQKMNGVRLPGILLGICLGMLVANLGGLGETHTIVYVHNCTNRTGEPPEGGSSKPPSLLSKAWSAIATSSPVMMMQHGFEEAGDVVHTYTSSRGYRRRLFDVFDTEIAGVWNFLKTM